MKKKTYVYIHISPPFHFYLLVEKVLNLDIRKTLSWWVNSEEGRKEGRTDIKEGRKEGRIPRKEGRIFRKEERTLRKEGRISRTEGQISRKEGRKDIKEGRKERYQGRKEGRISRKEGRISRKEGNMSEGVGWCEVVFVPPIVPERTTIALKWVKPKQNVREGRGVKEEGGGKGGKGGGSRKRGGAEGGGSKKKLKAHDRQEGCGEGICVQIWIFSTVKFG